MPNPFCFSYRIAMHDTDAAGVIFAPQIFRICHQAYEAMMHEIGFSIGSILQHRRFGLPVAHLEADYFQPLTVGDEIEIYLTVEAIKESSYHIRFEWKMNDELQARAKVVHVCINTQTLKAIPLPADLKSALEKHAA